jgi:hypothetical protein
MGGVTVVEKEEVDDIGSDGENPPGDGGELPGDNMSGFS